MAGLTRDLARHRPGALLGFGGDSFEVMKSLSDRAVALVVTSPPFPLTFRKRKPYSSVGDSSSSSGSFRTPMSAIACLEMTAASSSTLAACGTRDRRRNPSITGVFIKLCTEEGDLVLDPFAGSNVTGEAAERLGRGWLAIELAEEYLAGSRFRFNNLFRGAEINMHLSLSREMTPYVEVLQLLAGRGPVELALRLDRGEI